MTDKERVVTEVRHSCTIPQPTAGNNARSAGAGRAQRHVSATRSLGQSPNKPAGEGPRDDNDGGSENQSGAIVRIQRSVHRFPTPEWQLSDHLVRSAQTCCEYAHVVIKRTVSQPPGHKCVANLLGLELTQRISLVPECGHTLSEILITRFDEPIAVEHNRRSEPEELLG